MLVSASAAGSMGTVSMFSKVGTMLDLFCVFHEPFLGFPPHPFEPIFEIVLAFYSHVL